MLVPLAVVPAVSLLTAAPDAALVAAAFGPETGSRPEEGGERGEAGSA